MRKDLIAGNWKMHMTHLDAIQIVQKLSYRLEATKGSMSWSARRSPLCARRRP